MGFPNSSFVLLHNFLQFLTPPDYGFVWWSSQEPAHSNSFSQYPNAISLVTHVSFFSFLSIFQERFCLPLTIAWEPNNSCSSKLSPKHCLTRKKITALLLLIATLNFWLVLHSLQSFISDGFLLFLRLHCFLLSLPPSI